MCSNMDGLEGHYAKRNVRIMLDRERQIIYAITHIWNLKNITN